MKVALLGNYFLQPPKKSSRLNFFHQMESNRLQSLPPELALCTTLRKLNLRNNRLNSFPASMAGLTQLVQTKQLQIDHNPFPTDFRQRYQAGVAALFEYLHSFELSEQEKLAVNVDASETLPDGEEAQWKWRRGKKLGSGSSSHVYLGLNERDGCLMAVKSILLNSSNEAKLLPMIEREIRLMKPLSHPNIVTYRGACRVKGEFNLFMEYVPGGSVASALRDFGPLSESVTQSFTRQVLRALAYLHERDIVHRFFLVVHFHLFLWGKKGT